MVLISTVALVLLAGLVTLGTLFTAISEVLLGRRVVIGPEFYNNTLLVSGLVLLGGIVPAPLLEWGNAPTRERCRALAGAGLAACLGAATAALAGGRQPLTLALVGLAVGAVAALLGRVVIDVARRRSEPLRARIVRTLQGGRRTYAGFAAHLGVCCLAVGVAGSSLGSVRSEIDMAEGQTVSWNGRSVRFARLEQHRSASKLVVEAELEVRTERGSTATLRPAQHRHKVQELDVWTTEAAIQPLWSGDFYAILHHGDGSTAHFTFVFNPLMRCLWAGGWLIGLSALVGLWPERVRRLRPGADGPEERKRPAFERSRRDRAKASVARRP